ncbi:homeodomain-like protein [Tanacetum coccineum]
MAYPLPLDTAKHFKTLSLDESRSLDFDIFYDQEEYSEEEVAETMGETMEQYMRKTRADYGSGISRPKIEDKDSVHSSKTAADAKVAIQEMAEYSQKWYNGTSRTRSTETSARLAAIQAQLNNLGREIKKDMSVKNFQKRIVENVLVGIGKFVFPIDFIILDMPEDIKVPLILERPFLSTARAKIDVFKRKITLRVGEEKIIFKSKLRRDQVDDLMPTIANCEVIEEFRARNDASMVSKVFGYPSDCDYDKKIHFIVLEDMDAYRDEGMGDVIFGEPFFREVGINAKRFEGMITIHNGNDEVTYQMARTSLKEKKSTMLVENLQSGNLEVLEF